MFFIGKEISQCGVLSNDLALILLSPHFCFFIFLVIFPLVEVIWNFAWILMKGGLAYNLATVSSHPWMFSPCHIPWMKMEESLEPQPPKYFYQGGHLIRIYCVSWGIHRRNMECPFYYPQLPPWWYLRHSDTMSHYKTLNLLNQVMCLHLSFGLASEVPKLTHYGVV